MATEVAEQPPEAASAPAASAPQGIGKMKVLVLILVVMAVQGAAMYFLLPGPAGSGEGNADGDGALEGVAPAGIDANVATSEVPVDNFNCTNTRAAVGSAIHVTFKLVAVVAKDQEAGFDLAANKVHKHRVREAIVRVARSSSREDLNDPNLSTMKRLIKEEINKLLRKSYIIEVVISDFNTMEQ